MLQLRVVAGAPKSRSIWPRQPIVFMWRRYTPYTKRFFAPMICTSHSPPSGRAAGRKTLRQTASERMLTKGTTSAPGGSLPNGLSLSSRMRSLPSQQTIVASNGSFPRNSARNFARNPGLRITNVPAGPHVHGVVGTQFFGEHARTKSPVSSHVDTPEENYQSHAAHCFSNQISKRSGSGPRAWG